MEDRFSRTAARARERQLLAQHRRDAAFLRADQIADRLEELYRDSRRPRPDESAAFSLLAAERLAAARALAAAAAESYGDARCASGAYRRTPHSDTTV